MTFNNVNNPLHSSVIALGLPDVSFDKPLHSRPDSVQVFFCLVNVTADGGVVLAIGTRLLYLPY